VQSLYEDKKAKLHE